MPSPPKYRLALHPTGLWEATALVEGEEIHFGFFADREEAQRTLDAAAAGQGEETPEPDAS